MSVGFIELGECGAGGGVAVRSHSPITEAFFRRHRDDPAIVDLAVGLLDRLAEALSRYTDADAHRHESNLVLDYLRGMEARTVAAVRDAVERESAQHVTSVADGISRSVSDTVRTWLQTELSDLKGFHHEGRATLAAMETRLRDELACRVVQPMTERHDAVLRGLSSMPGALADTHQLQELRRRVDEGADAARVGVDRLLSEMSHLWQDSKQLPALVRSVVNESLGALEREAVAMRVTTAAAMHKADEHAQDIGLIRRDLETISQQVVRQSTSNRVKGAAGEAQLYDLLAQRLRRTSEVELVTGQAHCCDMVVRRVNHPDVRIECKAHSENTAERVRSKETARFRSDLMGLGSHGIFVSLFASIVGKGETHLECLPNGKYAVYLSNNGYNVDVLEDWILVIYQLDRATGDTASSEGEPGHHVSNEVMQEVQTHLADFVKKTGAIRHHMKSSIDLLNQMAFDRVTQLLQGGPAICAPQPPAAASAEGAFKCEACQKTFHTAPGLKRHSKACKAT